MTDDKKRLESIKKHNRYYGELAYPHSDVEFLLAQIDAQAAKIALAEEALDHACRCDKFHPDYALCGPCIALAALRKSTKDCP